MRLATCFPTITLSNAVVYNLGKHEQLDNPSYYSYEAVIESFLDADMNSCETKGIVTHRTKVMKLL